MNGNQRMDQVIKKGAVPAAFVSGVLLLAGFVLGRTGRTGIMVCCYLAAAFLCGVPVVIRAAEGLRKRTVAIEVLVSIAMLGALILRNFGEAAMVTFLFQFGNLLKNGIFWFYSRKVGGETDFAGIVALVEEAGDEKSPEEKFIDLFAKWYTPVVVVLAVAVLLFTRKPEVTITILVLACPGALVVGASVANAAGIGRAAKEQVLLKSGKGISAFAGTTVFAFDRTVLTQGCPQVVSFRYYEEDWKQALMLADAMERESDHPISRAIREYAAKLECVSGETVLAQEEKGKGIRAQWQGREFVMGSARYMQELGITLTEQVRADLNQAQEQGASALILTEGEKMLALFGVADRIKENAAQSLRELKDIGARRLVMLTGDNGLTARLVAKEAGIDEVYAEILPGEKCSVIERLQGKGEKVTYIGDSESDSTALAAATAGVAMGGELGAAAEKADVVLTEGDLWSLSEAYRLAKRTTAILRANIVIALGTVFLLLAGLFAGTIHIASGMFIHEASILAVVLNAMRLLQGPKEE